MNEVSPNTYGPIALELIESILRLGDKKEMQKEIDSVVEHSKNETTCETLDVLLFRKYSELSQQPMTVDVNPTVSCKDLSKYLTRNVIIFRLLCCVCALISFIVLCTANAVYRRNVTIRRCHSRTGYYYVLLILSMTLCIYHLIAILGSVVQLNSKGQQLLSSFSCRNVLNEFVSIEFKPKLKLFCVKAEHFWDLILLALVSLSSLLATINTITLKSHCFRKRENPIPKIIISLVFVWISVICYGLIVQSRIVCKESLQDHIDDDQASEGMLSHLDSGNDTSGDVENGLVKHRK